MHQSTMVNTILWEMLILALANVVAIPDNGSLFKLTEKHHKNHKTENKTNTQAPRMYTPKHPNILNHRK